MGENPSIRKEIRVPTSESISPRPPASLSHPSILKQWRKQEKSRDEHSNSQQNEEQAFGVDEPSNRPAVETENTDATGITASLRTIQRLFLLRLAHLSLITDGQSAPPLKSPRCSGRSCWSICEKRVMEIENLGRIVEFLGFEVCWERGRGGGRGRGRRRRRRRRWVT